MPRAIIITIVVVIILVGGWLVFSNTAEEINNNTAVIDTNTTTNVSDNIPATNITINSPVPTNTNTPEVTSTEVTPPTTLGPDMGPAPDFSFKDYNGNTVSLSDFKGKPIALNTWAAWCPFCVKELPAFASVQRELGDAIIIIAIDRAESLKTAKSYTDDLGVTNDLIFLLDPGDSFYTDIGGFSMPETLLVDGDGIIREHKRGTMDADELKWRLNDSLGVN
jgi:thiol-disulfide isomerase/thioredoxin